MASDQGDRAPGVDEISSPSRRDLSYADFDRVETLGRTATADIYLARVTTDADIERVALKEPRSGQTLTEDVFERFVGEVEDWAKIDDHPHVVGVVDWDQRPVPWIAMEYMDGGSLIDRTGELAVEEALWTALGITRGVAYAHRHGLVHHDLKPANILFSARTDTWDVPKVADWELAKRLIAHSQTVGEYTAEYAAPEQLRSEEYGRTDAKTDIFQLGAVLYELFTGTHPFMTEDEVSAALSILSDDPTPVHEVDPAFPVSLSEVVGTALAKEKSDRYDHVTELQRDLSDVLDGFESDSTDPRGRATETGQDEGTARSDTATTESGSVEAPDSGTGEPLREVDGIGPSFESELNRAGIDDIGDLAGADPERLASVTAIPRGRLERLTTRARAYVGTDVEEISGIGPAYAEELTSVGIVTVADLAEADPAEIAERSEVPEAHAERFVAAARTRMADTAGDGTVRGSATDPGPGERSAGSATETTDTAGPGSPAGDEASLRDVSGIGPAYAEELRGAGVGSPAELVDADPATLADEIAASEEQIRGWMFDAGDATELLEMEGVGETLGAWLFTEGIESKDDLAEADPDSLAAETPASADRIRSLVVEAADANELLNVDGVGETYATELVRAGVTSIEALASADPADLSAAVSAPPTRVEDWVAWAAGRKEVAEIDGIGDRTASTLESAGVETVRDLREASPSRVAEDAGVSEKRVRRWLVDAAGADSLTDIEGIGTHYASELARAGIRDPEALATAHPDAVAESAPGLSASQARRLARRAAEAVGPDLTAVSGIGDSYADRLREVGVCVLADLVEGAPDEIADAVGTSTRRVRRWQENAERLLGSDDGSSGATRADEGGARTDRTDRTDAGTDYEVPEPPELRTIDGIGQVTASRLRSLGYDNVYELAAADPADVASGHRRISRRDAERWVALARHRWTPLTEIDGIGSTYADRLNDHDVYSADQLTEVPPEAVSDMASVPEREAESWVQQAETMDRSITNIRGIGDSYARELAEQGIGSIGDLARVDPDELAGRIDAGKARIYGWKRRAKKEL